MPGREIVTISDGISESAIVPDLGAGLAWYDLVVGGKSAPIFRPCRNPSEAHPLDLGLKSTNHSHMGGPLTFFLEG